MPQLNSSLLHEGIRTWLDEHSRQLGKIYAVEKIGVGQSNPTFIIKTDTTEFILRSQPEGQLLPSAHAVDREFKVMSALKETDVPVPRMFSLCDDRERYGVKFFLMEKVLGETILDPSLPLFTADERQHFYKVQVNTLASLAQLDPNKLELSDYGKPHGYLDRQITIWTKQYRAAETQTIPAMENLITGLTGRFDEALKLPHAIVHGDFRQDNLLIQSKPSLHVSAVIDWELSTLGPVFVDLSYWCAMLRMEHDWAIGGLGGIDKTALNIPSEDELIAMFCDKTGLKKPNNWEFWIAFQLFRFASILQGIKKRHMDGNASADNAEAVGAQALPVAILAEDIMKSAG